MATEGQLYFGEGRSFQLHGEVGALNHHVVQGSATFSGFFIAKSRVSGRIKLWFVQVLLKVKESGDFCLNQIALGSETQLAHPWSLPLSALLRCWSGSVFCTLVVSVKGRHIEDWTTV